jgi:hypothetical protein
MKTKLLTLLLLCAGTMAYAQFTTGTVQLTTGYSAKIDTDATTVTLTLVGPDTVWLGIGFGGTTMDSAADMFIWNATASRDYSPSGSQSMPSPDAVSNQSWAFVSDNVFRSVRTVVATRPLVSAGDFAFANNTNSLSIIWAMGSGTSIAYHASRGGAVLARTQFLGLEDFSLNGSIIYPNPTNGKFSLKTKTALDKINIYTQTGAFVKTIDVKSENETQVNIEGLSSGVYLLELQNSTEKSWKKVIVE